MVYKFEKYDLKAWLNDPNVKEGSTKRELQLCGAYNDIYRLFARNHVILYFLMVYLGFRSELATLFNSTDKEKKLIKAVRSHLKHKRVEEPYCQPFIRSIKRFRDRADYVFYIIQENLRMTEYYPYFQAVGFTKLIDSAGLHIDSFTGESGSNEDFENFLQEIEDWNNEHTEEVEAYLSSIKEEKENMERHRQKIKDDVKREKEDARLAKKQQKEFDKETLRIRKQQKAEYHKLEKSFQRYYEGRA